MSEFEKNRIFFAVALIASSFAIYPILKDSGMVIYDPFIKVRFFYWIFIVILAISIYLYAASFIGETTNLKRTKKLQI